MKPKILLVYLFILIIVIILMAACAPGQPFEDPSVRATRAGQGTLYAQTVAAVATQSGTVAAMQVTVEYAVIMATQISQLTYQNQALQATLGALSIINRAQPPQGQQPNVSLGQGQASPVVLVTAAAPSYQNLTTAADIRYEDGCATGSQANFETSQEKIYLTVVAYNVAQGTRYTARWFYNKVEQPSNDQWTADQHYDLICIWFFRDGPFEPGRWSGELNANGVVIGKADFVTSAGRASPVPAPMSTLEGG